MQFIPSGEMQFVTNVPWIETYGINYYIGLDGFSLTILMMIAILVPTSYLLLWEGKTKGYWIDMLLVQKTPSYRNTFIIRCNFILLLLGSYASSCFLY